MCNISEWKIAVYTISDIENGKKTHENKKWWMNKKMVLIVTQSSDASNKCTSLIKLHRCRISVLKCCSISTNPSLHHYMILIKLMDGGRQLETVNILSLWKTSSTHQTAYSSYLKWLRRNLLIISKNSFQKDPCRYQCWNFASNPASPLVFSISNCL